MVLGITLRAIKTYQKTTYLSLSHADSFCGITGGNGIGKSSILEALDSFFGQKEYNINISTKKSGTSVVTPFVCPLLLIEKSKIDIKNNDQLILERMSDILWNQSDNYTIARNKDIYQQLKETINATKKRVDHQKYYLATIGETHTHSCSLGIFDTIAFTKYILETEIKGEDTANTPQDELEKLRPLLNSIRNHIDFIYIPAEITTDEFAALQSNHLNTLLGNDLSKILSKAIPQTPILSINKKLEDYIAEISNSIEPYEFRLPLKRQTRIKAGNVRDLVQSLFFNSRFIHVQKNGQWLRVSKLSSGEQQKALIHIIMNIASKYRSRNNSLIIAIDEPERSLHVSGCYEQFSNLAELSNQCSQLIFATHWYGFIPTASNGRLLALSQADSNFEAHSIDLYAGREAVTHLIKHSNGSAQVDLSLKSIFDFVSSIMTSVVSNKNAVWIICEGSTDKRYLNYYLNRELGDVYDIYLCPVGGIGDVKNIVEMLDSPFQSMRSEIKGCVIGLTDTDPQLVEISKPKHKNLHGLRIVYSSTKNDIDIVPSSSNPKSLSKNPLR